MKSEPHPYLHPQAESTNQNFLHYHHLTSNKKFTTTAYTYTEFLHLAYAATHTLNQHQITSGKTFLLCLGHNHPHDLAFRLAATFTRATPVTVNWQSDTPETISYKAEITQASLILFDSSTSPETLSHLKKVLPDTTLLDISHISPLKTPPQIHTPNPDDTRIIIFTSGTTGKPKGVELSYKNYHCNHLTFETFLDIQPETSLHLIAVNPLHHTNSTAITDWALRRPHTSLHLFQRYATDYWNQLTSIVENSSSAPARRIIAPTVARHFDFLRSITSEPAPAPSDQNTPTPINLPAFRRAAPAIDFLIGSAPVGPTTVETLKKLTGKIPLVRFGSTETCLQVMGTSPTLTESSRMLAFQAGWNHTHDGKPTTGYYIGRPHTPHTQVRIVRQIDQNHPDFLKDCAPGEPGYLITKGDNIMKAYVAAPEKTASVIHHDWYLDLGDIAFYRCDHENPQEKNYYWLSRVSNLLIKGGANYSCEQLTATIRQNLIQHLQLSQQQQQDLDLAVIGLKLRSEHEDDCCLAIELKTPELQNRQQEITDFLTTKGSLPKAACPDHVRYTTIPRNFKGALQPAKLKPAFT